MGVVAVPRKIASIADLVFPIAALPEAVFALSSAWAEGSVFSPAAQWRVKSLLISIQRVAKSRS
jgi:hypothetical protein